MSSREKKVLNEQMINLINIEYDRFKQYIQKRKVLSDVTADENFKLHRFMGKMKRINDKLNKT